MADDYLESKLAEFTRAYINAVHDGDETEQQEALRWVCTGLEYLLGSLLEEQGERSGWIDGIIPAFDMFPDAVSIGPGCEFKIRAQAVWVKDHDWIEPFFASVRISVTSDVIEMFRINCANASEGLGKTPYDKHIRWETWYSPAEWMFSFSKDTQL